MVRGAVEMLGRVLLVLMAAGALPSSVLAMIPDFLEFGSCADVTLNPNFDPVKYSGLWFDVESVPNEYQHTKKCVTQNYNWTGETVAVSTRGLTEDGKKVRQEAVMHREQQHPAHMTVHAAGVPKAPYKIVATDYGSFSCVYSCLGYFGFRAEFMWVFGRTPTLPPAKVQHCHKVFASMGVDPSKMIPILQGELACPYGDKLKQMLAESEQHLLDVLGPYVPTTTTTLPPQEPGQDVVKVEEKMESDTETQLETGQKSQHSDLPGTGSAVCPGGCTPSAAPQPAFLTLQLLPLLLLPLLLA